MNESNPQPGGAELAAGANVARGRRTLILLFLAGGLPVLASFGLYLSGMGIPDGRTNRGALIQPPVALGPSDLVDVKKQQAVVFKPDEKWLVFVAGEPRCDATCEAQLNKTLQVTKALGRHALRVKRGYVLTGVEPSTDLLSWAAEEHPWMQFLAAPPNLRDRLKASVGERELDGNEIFIADPLGNVMMLYGSGQDGRDLLDDLNRLLKVSKIG